MKSNVQNSQTRRARVPSPPTERISSGRVKLIKTVAIVAAVALTIFDAKISYDGFRQLDLPQYVPLVLAGLIFVIQLASGAIQQLGMSPFRGVGGSEVMDWFWRWCLISVYVIDIGSNAIAFGVGREFTTVSLMTQPVESITITVVLVALACLLTFGDEILLRLVDRLDVGARANDMAAKKGGIDRRAYEQFLRQYEQRARAQATEAGRHAQVDFEWLHQTHDV